MPLCSLGPSSVLRDKSMLINDVDTEGQTGDATALKVDKHFPRR